MTTRRNSGALALTVVLLMLVGALLAGCDSRPAASPKPAEPTLIKPSPPPPVNGCNQLAFAVAAKPTGGGQAVRCGKPHTSITYYVGSYQPIQDGHLLAVGSTHVQAQLAARCPRLLSAYLGGDKETLRLSRFEALWFAPTLAQAERGAHWFRCDVVAVSAGDHFAPLTRSLRGALSSPTALDRWGTCSTAAPTRKNAQTVLCNHRHSWRAIKTVDLTGRRYLAKSSSAAGNTACKDAASLNAHGALKYAWIFQWPSRAAWNAGERYGLCWVPDSA